MEVDFMKNLLLVYAFIITMPSYALCSIDAENSLCSLPDMGTRNMPIFKNINTEANLNKKPLQLQPFQNQESLDQMKLPNNELMKYDSGCQFGVCIQDLQQNLPTVNN